MMERRIRGSHSHMGSRLRGNDEQGREMGISKLTEQLGDFSPLETLRGKEILLTGSTGFVGKVLLSMLLRYQPSVGHVHCVIRRGKGKDVRTRFRDEVLSSPVLAPV